MPALVTIKRIGKEEKMRTKRKKQIVWEVIILFVLVAAAVGAVQFKRIHEQKMAEKNAVQKVKSVDDLAGRKIGVQIGTTGDIYSTDYAKENKGTEVERYNKGADAIQALKVGKIDSVIIDEQPAKAYCEKNPELKILKDEFANEDYAVCVAKGNDTLREQINQALDEITKDGTMQKINDYYIGVNAGKDRYQADPKNPKKKKLTMATNAEFPPYEYYDKGKIVGIDADMMQAVCDRLGMDLEIQNMDFDSIITAVTSGKVDVGAAGMTVTEDRLKNIDFTNKYTTAKQVVIVKGTKSVVKKQTFREAFYNNFVKEHRYEYLLKGFGNTLVITFFAIIIGIVFGLIISLIRTSHDRNGSWPILNALCRIYITVMRGTPAVVQLMIIYYVILTSVQNKIVVAIIGFGLNSAAYVSEVMRSGIMSVDQGQFEAGRSLGLNYWQTMRSVIIPQAFKNILPALGNEFIVLIKETSISGYIGMMDLTKGGDIVRSITYEAYMPLFAVAIVYLVTVMILSAGVNKLERKLRNSER